MQGLKITKYCTLACFAFSIVACSSFSNWQRRHAVEGANEEVSQRLSAMTLATLSHGNNGDGIERLRVLVSQDSVTVDNAAWLEEQTDEFLVPLTVGRGMLVSTTDANPSAPAIAEAISHALGVEKIAGKNGTTRAGEAAIYIDSATATKRIQLMLDVLARGGVSKVHFGYNTKEGIRFFDTQTPPQCGEQQIAAETKLCAVPEIEVVNDGAMVRAFSRVATAPHCPVQIPEGEDKAWQARVMLPRGQRCPSIPLDGAEQDLRALTKLLREVQTISPKCQFGVVSAAPDTSWSAIAPVALGTRLHSPFTQLIIALSSEPYTQATACTNGLRPAELPGVAKQLADTARAVKHLSILGIVDDMQE